MSTTAEDARLFSDLVTSTAPDVQLRPLRFRGGPEVLHVIYNVIVAAANLGGFLGFCAACRSFLTVKPQYEIEFSYHDIRGEFHEARYSHATIDQIDHLLRLHSPDHQQGVQVRIFAPSI